MDKEQQFRNSVRRALAAAFVKNDSAIIEGIIKSYNKHINWEPFIEIFGNNKKLWSKIICAILLIGNFDLINSCIKNDIYTFEFALKTAIHLNINNQQCFNKNEN